MLFMTSESGDENESCKESVVKLDLSEVSHDDQNMVRDVCAVMSVIRKELILTNFKITMSGQFYIITADFPKTALPLELGKAEMDTITDVNPLRVTCVSLVCDVNNVTLKVRVSSVLHPITVTDTSIVRVVKKRRWLL